VGGKRHLNFPDENAPAPALTSSKYKGVTKVPTGKFRACIRSGGGPPEYLGQFDDEREAAEAYDARARELGKHAWCNFDEDDLA